VVALRRNPDPALALSNISWEFDWEVFILQEVEDWYLALCERKPGLADRVTEAIEALVAEGPTLVDHIKGSTLHNLRNSDRRGAPLTSGSCSSSSETPSGASGCRRQGRELEGLVRHEDPDRRVSLRPMDQETGGRISEKKPTARPWSAVKRDAVASGAMAQERLEADTKRTIAEVRAHRLAEIRREQSTTQSALAKIMHVSQGRVSQIESGRLANSELGTLRSYVEALGGSLRIVADFGDGELTIID
jgi:DNA-binding XRE family transcriptional regulator